MCYCSCRVGRSKILCHGTVCMYMNKSKLWQFTNFWDVFDIVASQYIGNRWLSNYTYFIIEMKKKYNIGWPLEILKIIAQSVRCRNSKWMPQLRIILTQRCHYTYLETMQRYTHTPFSLWRKIVTEIQTM